MPEVPVIPPKDNEDEEDNLIRAIRSIRAKYPNISDKDLLKALETGIIRFAPTPEW